MHIPIFRLVKLNFFFAQLPVDHLPHSVPSSLIPFLYKFTVLAYYMIDPFFFLSLHNLPLLFWCVLSIFAWPYLVLMALFWAVIRRNSFSLLIFSLSEPRPSLLVGDFACLLLETCIQLFFFPFLFCSYCCSIDPCIVCFVSGCCNKFFFTLSHHIDISMLSSILARPLPWVFLFFRVLRTRSNLSSFTRAWRKARPFRSPGLFWVC